MSTDGDQRRKIFELSSDVSLSSAQLFQSLEKPQPLGMRRIEMVRLVRFFASTGYKRALSSLIESKLLSKVLDLFFVSGPYNSILSCEIEELLINQLLEVQDEELVSYLLRRYHLHKKILTAVEKEKRVCEGNERWASHGSMMQIANALNVNKRSKVFLRKNEPWQQFTKQTLRPFNQSSQVDELSLPKRDPKLMQEIADLWSQRWDQFSFMISS